MADETYVLLTLLEIKFKVLNDYATSGMAWWVSSVVFCATVIGAT